MKKLLINLTDEVAMAIAALSGERDVFVSSLVEDALRNDPDVQRIAKKLKLKFVDRPQRGRPKSE